MRIAYIGHTRFPTEKAHGRQIAEVCSAIASLGHEVTLITPTVHTPITESPFSFYGVPENFSILKLKSFDALHSKFIPQFFAFLIGMWSYRRALRLFLQEKSFDLLYCRSHAVLPLLLQSGIPTVIELHTLPGAGSSRFVRLCSLCTKVVCLTSPMSEELASKGVPKEKIFVESDAVGEAMMTDRPSAPQSSTPVIGYVGSLVARNTLSKGVDVLLDALATLRAQNISVRGLIVGGPDSWKEQYEEEAKKLSLSDDVIFTGHVKANEVAAMMATCDVLVYPAPHSSHPYFVRDTSPLKLFEYMASSRPIVCADLPPIRDILDESSACFFTPGDSDDLARAIRETINDSKAAQERAQKARQLVENHTWKKRMERILSSANT